MRLRFLPLAAVALLPLAAPAARAQGVPQATAPAEDPLLARVEGQDIRLSDLLDTARDVLPPDMRDLPPPMLLQVLPPDARRQLLERTITERALTGAARAAGLDKEEAVRRRIRRAEDQELQQAYLAREVAAGVTDTAVRARYDQEMAKRQGEEEVHARHILLRTEAEAKQALAAVKGGEDFGEVAKRLSTDPGSRDGGDLGFFKRGDMVPEFAEAAFAMKPGEVSATPVKSPFGWHIIKVEERRAAPSPSFEESRQQLRQQMLQEQVDAVVQRVRATAKIERLDQPATGSSLLDNAAPPAASPPAGARPAAPQRR